MLKTCAIDIQVVKIYSFIIELFLFSVFQPTKKQVCVLPYSRRDGNFGWPWPPRSSQKSCRGCKWRQSSFKQFWVWKSSSQRTPNHITYWYVRVMVLINVRELQPLLIERKSQITYLFTRFCVKFNEAYFEIKVNEYIIFIRMLRHLTFGADCINYEWICPYLYEHIKFLEYYIHIITCIILFLLFKWQFLA